MDPHDPTYTLFLQWRGVQTPCPKCKGTGSVLYGNTSTWRGGMGGAAMTRDVCDGCWGSGDKDRPWLDLRSQRDEMNQEIAARAGDLLSRAVGSNLTVTRPAIEALAVEMDKLEKSRPRTPRPRFFHDLAKSLAKSFRAMASTTK